MIALAGVVDGCKETSGGSGGVVVVIIVQLAIYWAFQKSSTKKKKKNMRWLFINHRQRSVDKSYPWYVVAFSPALRNLNMQWHNTHGTLQSETYIPNTPRRQNPQLSSAALDNPALHTRFHVSRFNPIQSNPSPCALERTKGTDSQQDDVSYNQVI